MHTSRERGFTILEMLTVIFIVGVLSSVVVVGLQSSRQKARDDERYAHLAQLQIALEMYYNGCGRQYPATLNPTADNGCPTTGGGVTFATFLKSGALPTDPKDGSDYMYAVNDATTPTDYVLKATFETPHAALSKDVDGANVLSAGIDCDEDEATTPPNRFYCVKP